jgi:hypothetical protein
VNGIKNEPVLTAIYALVIAARVLLVAFGVHLTEIQSNAVDGFVLAALGLGLVVRSAVSPTRKQEAFDG